MKDILDDRLHFSFPKRHATLIGRNAINIALTLDEAKRWVKDLQEAIEQREQDASSHCKNAPKL